MKVSDYIVDFLVKKGITDVFGYPGGMVTHLMESFRARQEDITAHVTYHEQGAAFAACGYAQISGKPGVAYATSGPGATNLITGIANAYFDSIPTLFITGQVNSNEAKGDYGVRQRGFQETDIVSIVRPVVKYAAYVSDPEQIPAELEKAYQIALSGRRGPVLLDIPMNVFRSQTTPVDVNVHVETAKAPMEKDYAALVQSCIRDARRPCFLIGNGVKSAAMAERVRKLLDQAAIPAVTSMIAFDVPSDSPWNFGFIGAYGMRAANFLAAKSDLIISVGSRLDVRQVGGKRENFAPGAKILRFDIDPGELTYPIHSGEIPIVLDMDSTLSLLEGMDYGAGETRRKWMDTCCQIQKTLEGMDDRLPNRFMKAISSCVSANTPITADVGQNQVWTAQSFQLKQGQQVLFSGGHGAMGYALPAAIGACHAAGGRDTVCITGDGGLQMNIQELQYIVREQLPIKIVVFNNQALGMIRHFQEMYFDNQYFQTKPQGGYTAPCFGKIAQAYGMESITVACESDCRLEEVFSNGKPCLIEVLIQEDTYVFPKLEFGKPNQDQEPLLDRTVYHSLMALGEEA